jgi:hypothetical protein
MALVQSVDWITGEVVVSRADMPVIQVSPEVRQLNTSEFFTELKDLEASTEGAPWPDIQRHFVEYTVSGITYAEAIIIIAPYFITFEDGQYAVSLRESNNNIIDVATQNQVSILGNNSAGLIDVPITETDKQDIIDRVFTRVIETGETFEEALRLIRADAAGSIVVTGTENKLKSADGTKDRVIANADETGRTVTSTDSS